MLFNSKNYWELRLRKSFDSAGVGFHAVGREYNEWLYKIRGYVFKKALRKITLQIATSKILDIGSGTGFYIEQLKKLGAMELTGLDFTEVAVSHLSKKFPEYKFLKADITDKALLGTIAGKFDIVTAMDVFFHIVDDYKYQLALNNVSGLLSEHGYLVMSETPAKMEKSRDHIKDRTSAQIHAGLRAAGFNLIDTIPMFLLMNPPIGSSNSLLHLFSDFRLKVLRWAFRKNIRPIGFFTGMMLFPLEWLLQMLWKGKDGPCTNVYILEKQSPTNEG